MVVLGAMRDIAQTGEIRKEYEQEMSKIQQERAEQELASEKLIKEILAQEEKELAAFRVANKENKPATASHSQSIRLSLPKRSSSLDSITGEYSRYFKPIARYPRTPPRPNEKAKGYPETIKVTPCPQTVKKLDFASGESTPDVSSISETHSGPSSSKTAIVSLTNYKLDSTDHSFALPRQAVVDEQSNDGLSVVSSTTDTSISNYGLRIGTTSPVIPVVTPGTFSSIASSDRSETMSDTLSYRSDISPQVKRRRGRAAAASVKKNGHINCKSSRTRKRQQNGQDEKSKINSRNDSCTPRCSSKTRSGSSARTRSSAGSAKESAHNNRSPATKTCNSTEAVNNSVSNGHSLKAALVDSDEVYARKLQDMYNAETKYKLTSLRFAGTDNEYNIRKRARPTTNS